jgi:hypothetical protein
MKFQKGVPRPANAGRKKGSKNKKKIMLVDEFIRSQDINIAGQWYAAVLEIEKPAERAKALSEIYRYLDAPVKEKLSIEDEEETESTGSEASAEADILSIVGLKK